jgi:endonuclease I
MSINLFEIDFSMLADSWPHETKKADTVEDKAYEQIERDLANLDIAGPETNSELSVKEKVKEEVDNFLGDWMKDFSTTKDFKEFFIPTKLHE